MGREREQQSGQPSSAGSLLRWPQGLGLQQAEAGGWDSIWVPHAGGRDQSVQAIFCCLPRCISRELAWKWNSRALNWCSRMECLRCTTRLVPGRAI